MQRLSAWEQVNTDEVAAYGQPPFFLPDGGTDICGKPVRWTVLVWLRSIQFSAETLRGQGNKVDSQYGSTTGVGQTTEDSCGMTDRLAAFCQSILGY